MFTPGPRGERRDDERLLWTCVLRQDLTGDAGHGQLPQQHMSLVLSDQVVEEWTLVMSQCIGNRDGVVELDRYTEPRHLPPNHVLWHVAMQRRRYGSAETLVPWLRRNCTTNWRLAIESERQTNHEVWAAALAATSTILQTYFRLFLQHYTKCDGTTISCFHKRHTHKTTCVSQPRGTSTRNDRSTTSSRCGR